MTPETQKQLKITDVSAKKLEKLNLHTAWDLVLHLPLRYEDETHIMPIKDAPIGVPCQVEGEVIHQEVTFKPRKQLIVQIADGSGSVLFLRFIHFYTSNQKQMAVGKRIRAVGEIKHGFHGDEMIHPKIRDAESSGLAESLTPIYPTVNGLNQPTLRRIIQTALDVTPLHDTLPDTLLGRLKLPHLAESLRLCIHRHRVSLFINFQTARCLHGNGSNLTNFWRNSCPCGWRVRSASAARPRHWEATVH